MAGKRKKNEEVKMEFNLTPIEQETWINQPQSVTRMRHNLTVVQNKILVNILVHFQQKIREQMDFKKAHSIREPQLFTDEELGQDGKIPIRINFNELGVSPNNYGKLRNMFKALATSGVEIPFRGEDGMDYDKITNLCDVYIPRNNAYRKYAIVKFDASVAERLISIDLGYDRIGKEIIFSANCKYTQRIYPLLVGRRKDGYFVIKTKDLRQMLMITTKYRRYTDFEDHVLRASSDEMTELCRQGACDITFRYENIYADDKHTRYDDPDRIKFRIIEYTELAGHPRMIDQQLTAVVDSQFEQLKNLIMKHFKVAPPMAQKLVDKAKLVTTYDNFATKLTELAGIVRDPNIRSVPAYATKSLVQFLEDEEKAGQEPTM